MAVNYGRALSRGFRFMFVPKRWLPFFILDILFFSAIFSFMLSNLPTIMNFITELNANPMAFASLFGYGAIIIAGFIVWGLIRIWVQGAVIYQSYREKEFNSSWKISCRKYFSMLAAIVVVGAISFVVTMALGLIPFIGGALSFIASIVISMMFFFFLQGILINNMGFYRTLKNTYSIFTKKPFEVFIMWLVITVLSIIIVGIFSIPSLHKQRRCPS
jgi:hypothetical protein